MLKLKPYDHFQEVRKTDSLIFQCGKNCMLSVLSRYVIAGYLNHLKAL